MLSKSSSLKNISASHIGYSSPQIIGVKIQTKKLWVTIHLSSWFPGNNALPETNISNIAFENRPLGKEIPISNHNFRRYVSFREIREGNTSRGPFPGHFFEPASGRAFVGRCCPDKALRCEGKPSGPRPTKLGKSWCRGWKSSTPWPRHPWGPEPEKRKQGKYRPNGIYSCCFCCYTNENSSKITKCELPFSTIMIQWNMTQTLVSKLS